MLDEQRRERWKPLPAPSDDQGASDPEQIPKSSLEEFGDLVAYAEKFLEKIDSGQMRLSSSFQVPKVKTEAEANSFTEMKTTDLVESLRNTVQNANALWPRLDAPMSDNDEKFYDFQDANAQADMIEDVLRSIMRVLEVRILGTDKAQ